MASSAGGCVARNSLVLILFRHLLEVERSVSESESPASVHGYFRFCGADLVLISESSQSSGRWSSEESLGRVSSVLSVWKFIGLRTGGEPPGGYDIHLAGAKSLSETFDCLPSGCWIRA